jgi:hypothetical protein
MSDDVDAVTAAGAVLSELEAKREALARENDNGIVPGGARRAFSPATT